MVGKTNKKWKYILIYGELYYALPVLVLTVLIDKKLYNGQFTAKDITIKILVWLVAGVFWGYMMYNSSEKSYHAFLKKRQNQHVED